MSSFIFSCLDFTVHQPPNVLISLPYLLFLSETSLPNRECLFNLELLVKMSRKRNSENATVGPHIFPTLTGFTSYSSVFTRILGAPALKHDNNSVTFPLSQAPQGSLPTCTVKCLDKDACGSNSLPTPTFMPIMC